MLLTSHLLTSISVLVRWFRQKLHFACNCSWIYLRHFQDNSLFHSTSFKCFNDNYDLVMCSFWGIPRRLSSNSQRSGTHCQFHLHRHLPTKMEPTVSSETSTIRTQTQGNYPKKNTLHLEHGERLKTRNYELLRTLRFLVNKVIEYWTVYTCYCKYCLGSQECTHFYNWLVHSEALMMTQ